MGSPAPALPRGRRDLALALALMAASGALVLVYELSWVRRYAVLLGSTAPALAATISAALLGLAVGSAFFGRRAARWRRPWRAYAALELGAGCFALWVVPVQAAHGLVAPRLDAALEAWPALLLAVRGAIVLASIFPACFLLGGALPALTQALDEGRGAGGLRSGSLYAASTLGAVAGALAFPFALLPFLGAPLAYALAAAGSLALGALAFLLRGRHEAPRVPPCAPPLPGAPAESTLLALAAASGLVTLSLELVFARMLAQVHHSAIHAFALVLALFLAALGLGAAAAGALLMRGLPPWRLLMGAWLLAGLATLAAPPIFLAGTDGLGYLAAESPGQYLRALLVLGASTFLLPSLCAGAALPLLFALATRRGGPAAAPVGRLLAANGAGAVAGPLLATFVLFPLLGMWGTAVALGLALGLLGLAAAALDGLRLRAPAALFLAVALPLGGWVLGSPRVHLREDQGEELAWIAEGSHGIVSVIRDPGGLRLALDGSYTLGGSRALGDERQLGHIPLLLSPAPRRVAFLGLGTGISASAALLHAEAERIVVFELVPEVARAAREHFGPYNLGLLDDPRVQLVAGDARGHLRAQRGAYDVIVGDLVVPWRRGEAALFTREHFENVRRALAPGGLFCQWLPLYQMSAEELRIVAATFTDAFPRASLWRGDFLGDFPALALIAGAGGEPLDPEAIDLRVVALAPALARDHRYLVEPAGLWLHLVGELAAGDPWLAGAPRHTDARPHLELLSARTHFPGRARSGALLLGRPLSALLGRFGGPPAESGPLALLDAQRLAWRDLGARLFHASCLAAEGDGETARELAFAALLELPPGIQRRVLGPEPGGDGR